MRLGRIAALVPIVLVTAVPMPAHGSGYARHASASYQRLGNADVTAWTVDCSTGQVSMIGGAGLGPLYSTVAFRTKKDERSVLLRIADDVPGHVVLGARLLSRYEGPDKGFCGYTFKRFRVVGGRPLYVGVMQGLSEQGPSLPTAGHVYATFYR